MFDLLNSYGLPNEIGFEIKDIEKFFDNTNDYKRLVRECEVKGSEIFESYGIPNTLFFSIPFKFSIESYDGKKVIAIDKFYIMNAIYNYFNEEEKYSGSIYFNHNDEKEVKIKEEIKELKQFLSDKIKDLSKVEQVEELKNISILMYNAYMKAYKGKEDALWNYWFKSELEKDIEVFKRLKMWLSNFIDDISKAATKIDTFKKINLDKFKLFLIWQYIILGVSLKAPHNYLLIHSVIQIFNSIDKKDVSLDNVTYLGVNNNLKLECRAVKEITYIKIEKIINSFLEDKQMKTIIDSLNEFEINKDETISFDEFSNTILNVIERSIKKANEIGAKNIDLNELDKSIKERLSHEQTPEKQNKLKSYIDRIEFYKNVAKPYKVQEGVGIFKYFHVIYFTNGNVAIDKLNGDYGYLYIMPINVYFDIISSNKYKNIIEIRSIITVTPISHKNIKWKEKAHNEINNHSITPEEYEILESISDCVSPLSDIDLEKAKKKFADNEYLLKKIKEKEEERKRKYEEIDTELRKQDFSDYSESQEASESNLLLDAEDEIINHFANFDDFVSIYEYQNKIKTNRNPKVSLDTKRRTVGTRGEMKCELCGFESFSTRNFESHHIIPLSEGGIDNVYNTICLCGMCHNRIHSKIAFTYEIKKKMLNNVRENLKKATPQYIKNFDRLFNPNYNQIYNNNLSDEELLVKYREEDKYYGEHKEQEDINFLTEWNSFRRK